MNRFIPEEKENPIVTLKAQAEKFDFSKLRADKNNKLANTGKQMYEDFRRMRFVINGKSLDKTLVGALIEGAEQRNLDEAWDGHYADQEIPGDKKTDQYKESFKEFYNLGKKHTHLLPKGGDENKNYRPFAKEVFKEMFNYAKAEVPSDPILEELVTNCNQAGYKAALLTQTSPELSKYSLTLQNPVKVMNVDCADINHITVKSDMVMPVVEFDNPEETLGKLSGSLEFILESQDGKDDIAYKDGKVSLTVPRELKNYKADDKNLFDIIKEYFQKFCEKLGFKFEVEIEHNLGDPLEVSAIWKV